MSTVEPVARAGLPSAVTNTHIITTDFELLEPVTVDEALREMSRAPASVIAGGTDLLVQMKLERRRPVRVISLGRIPGLCEIEVALDGISIGAMTSIAQVAADRPIQEHYTALAEACRAFSTAAIMVMGTIGGNLCNASPASDTAPALLAFDTTAELFSPRGTRRIALHELFVAPGRTVLGADELLRSLHLPSRPCASGSAFIKMGRVEADISKVCVAVSIVRDADRVSQCRIALGSVAPTPVYVRDAESALAGSRMTAAAIGEAGRLVTRSVAPISDQRSTADYRRHVAGVSTGDALRAAWARAGGDPV